MEAVAFLVVLVIGLGWLPLRSWYEQHIFLSWTRFPVILYYCDNNDILTPVYGFDPRWIIGFRAGCITRQPRLWLRTVWALRRVNEGRTT